MAQKQDAADFRHSIDQYHELLAERIESTVQSVGTDEWVEEYLGRDHVSVGIRTGIQRSLEMAEDLERDNQNILRDMFPGYEPFPRELKWYQRLRFAIREMKAMQARLEEELEIAVFLVYMRVNDNWSFVASELLGQTRQAASQRYGSKMEKRYLMMMMDLMQETEPEAFIAAARRAIAERDASGGDDKPDANS